MTVAGEALLVNFAGLEATADAVDGLTFGRAADLVLDDDPHLHRVMGRFQCRSGHWWIENHAEVVGMTVAADDGSVALSVAPGAAAALPNGRSRLRFEVGPARFELELDVRGVAPVDPAPVVPDGLAPPTREWGRLDLNREQRLLLVVLAEARLRDPALIEAELPSNRVVAARLGWTITKFNRKLDYLCKRLSQLGVPGLTGDVAGSANDRRFRLVDHAVRVGLVDDTDLSLLDALDR